MNTATMERPAATAQATITVQYVNPPKAPRKSGSVKDVDGQIFSVWPNMLNQFREGESYEIEFTEKNVNGAIYRDIKRARVATPPGPAPDNFVLTPEVQRQARPANTISNGHAVGTRKAPMNDQQYFKPTSPKDARRMFICSQMNALIASRQVTLTSEGIAEAIQMISAAYDATIGREDMVD